MPRCADQFKLAEFGGALVSRIDGESDSARQFRECAGTKPGNRGILQAWNQNPRPFIWSATVEEIIKKDRSRAGKDGGDQTRIPPAHGQKEGAWSVSLYTGHTTSSHVPMLHPAGNNPAGMHISQ